MAAKFTASHPSILGEGRGERSHSGVMAKSV